MTTRESRGDRMFQWGVYFITALICIVTLYPLIYAVSASLSSPEHILSGKVWLWPVDLTFDAYRRVFASNDIMIGYRNTICYALGGTLFNMIMTIMAAYPLSLPDLKGRNALTFFITFTMFFSGGMIPLYLTVKQFGMMDTIWALVLPGAISTYNMIVIRTAFQSIPDSLIESAQLDGANDLIILWKIVVPLSKATLATMLLFYAVTHWNSYFDAMLYINKKEMYPLQIMLRNMLIGGLFNEETAIAGANADSFAVTDATLRSAAIIVTTLPILVVYPFVQRYFVKGVMIGGVKG